MLATLLCLCYFMPYLLPFTLSYSVILAIAHECAMSASASTRSTFSKFLHFYILYANLAHDNFNLSLSLSIFLTVLSSSFSGFYLFCIFITFIFIAQSCRRVRRRLLERLRLLRSTSKVSTERQWERESKNT